MELVLFNRCKYNEEMVRRIYRRSMRLRRCVIWLAAVSLLGYAVYYTVSYHEYWPDAPKLAILNLVLYALAALYIFLGVTMARRAAKLYMRRLREQRKLDAYEGTIAFYPEEISSRYDIAQDPTHVGYENVKRILVDRGLILLRTKANVLLSLDAARFENGTEADFWKLMNEKCPKAVPRKYRV